MSIINFYKNDKFLLIISILSGLIVGLLVTFLCIKYKLTVMGVNINIFIAPVIAGFVETLVSGYTREKSSNAVSAIIIFLLTNGIGWLFPAKPLTFNIFTVGGFFLMLQAAFPLFINYVLIGLFLLITYAIGSIGGVIGSRIHKKQFSSSFDEYEFEELNVEIFNSKPDIPIKEYHGLVFAEDVLEFEDKNRADKLQYMSSSLKNRESIKLTDYSRAREYILHNLKKEALKMNANAVIDIELDYTNYNQQMPPDIIIAAYGTAVTIDEKYLNNN